MAVENLALQPYSTGPNTAMTPQTFMPGQLDHLPSSCTPVTNVPNIVPTSIAPAPLDHDIVMTPKSPMPGYLPSRTLVTNVPNTVPTSITPKPAPKPPNVPNAMPTSVIPQLRPGQGESNTMDLDLDLPPSPSCSTSSNLHPATSGRPMWIPESFESVIQRTVKEWLILDSTELVQEAVSGVVDACIPRLVELIDAKITSFASDRTKGSCTPSGCGNDGWEGDNEDESPSPKDRKKPGSRGHRNHLHVWHILTPGHQLMVSQSAYRKYLTEKGVMTTRSSKGLTPVQAPPNQVEAFNQDGSSPPTIESVAIDWTTSLKSSPWNQEMVHLLAVDFHVKLKIHRNISNRCL